MTYLEGQIEMSKAYVAYWQTLILSGHYKTRKVYHGTGTDHPLTEAELLKDAMGAMKRHVDRLGELTEKLPEAG